MKYQNFRELKEHYLRTIHEQQKTISSLNEKLNKLESWAEENKDRIAYFENLAKELEDVRSGFNNFYVEREIAFLNRDYYNELESRAALIDNLEYYKDLLNKTIAEYEQYKKKNNKLKKEVLYEYDF